MTGLLLLLTAACLDPPKEKKVSFSILEDYDKGQDLGEIARDFELMKELEIDVLRCSFGWDDFEPEPGRYDFEWLKDFVSLAERHGIRIRPYLGYTPSWAGRHGKDGQVWNDPPRGQEQWSRFVQRLARELRPYRNVLSYEIYNEVDDSSWWEGTIDEYVQTLGEAARAIRAADPGKEILLAGLVYPDDDFLSGVIERGGSRFFDILPFHAYPETWSGPGVEVETYLGPGYRERFLGEINQAQRDWPIWINEMGYPTSPPRTEADQANWWARAVATFLAAPGIQHLGIYEIKDLPPDRPAIGNEANYHLGITYANGEKKLAFHTLDLITDLLDVGSLIVADPETRVSIIEGRAGELYHHLFIRPDGDQVLFLYDKKASVKVRVDLPRAGSATHRFLLDGSPSENFSFDGRSLSVPLAAGEVAIFRVER